MLKIDEGIFKTKSGAYQARIRFQGRDVKKSFDYLDMATDYRKYVKDGMSPNDAYITALGFDASEVRQRQQGRIEYRDYIVNIWLPALSSGEACTKTDGRPQQDVTNVNTLKRLKPVFPMIGTRYLRDLVDEDYLAVRKAMQTQKLARPKGREPHVFAPSSANKTLKLMRQSLRYAVRRKFMASSPWEGLPGIHEPHREKVHWTMRQCQLFLDQVRDGNAAHYAFFVTGISTGLRRGELFGLQLGDVDHYAGEVSIRRQWDEFYYGCPERIKVELRKRNDGLEYEYSEDLKERWKKLTKAGRPLEVIPMTELLADVLREHTRTMIGDRTFVFNFGRWQKKNPKAVIEPYAKKAGIPVISIHRLRTSFISNLTRFGVNEAIIAKLARCSKANLVNYQSLVTADGREALESLFLARPTSAPAEF